MPSITITFPAAAATRIGAALVKHRIVAETATDAEKTAAFKAYLITQAKALVETSERPDLVAQAISNVAYTDPDVT